MHQHLGLRCCMRARRKCRCAWHAGVSHRRPAAIRSRTVHGNPATVAGAASVAAGNAVAVVLGQKLAEKDRHCHELQDALAQTREQLEDH